jgi:hypothetical protein
VALTNNDLSMLDEDTGYKALPTPSLPSMPSITPPSFPPLTPVFQDANPLETQPVAVLRDEPGHRGMDAHPLPDEDVADLPVAQKQEDVTVVPVAPAPPAPAPQPISVQPLSPFLPPTQPAAEQKKPMFSLAPIKHAAPAPKSPNPKDAINSLLGELTMVGKLGTPSVVRVDLPGGMDSGEVEVVVLVKQNGQVIGEGSLKRSAPSKGVAAKLSVELRRP